MITKRTLEQWRSDALKFSTADDVVPTLKALEMCARIIRLTAELLDQHLMKR